MCHVKLYDSGIPHCISPDLDHMIDIQQILLKSFTAANQQKFSTMGVGDLIIKIPNGVEVLKLHLMDVLYSYEVGYTLVSISHLDELGLLVTFANGYCTIHDADGKIIGHIQQLEKGLYCVIHKEKHAITVTE